MRITVEDDKVLVSVPAEDDDEVTFTLTRSEWATFFAVAKAAFGKPKEVTAKSEGFDSFWSLYPRKIAKPDAVRAWGSVADDCEAVLNAVRSFQFASDAMYIPYPATWLRQRRWEDTPASDDSTAGAL